MRKERKKVFLFTIIVFLFLFIFTFFVSAEQELDYSSIEMKKYENMRPFLEFSYLDFMIPVNETVLGEKGNVKGYMVDFAVKDKLDLPIRFTILLIRTNNSMSKVIDIYLTDLSKYLEEDYSWHIFSTSVVADGDFTSMGGWGYVASGEVVVDSTLKGMDISEEFRNIPLPGSIDLRLIFKYPTDYQKDVWMRNCLATILGTLVVHTDKFTNQAGVDLSILDSE